MIIAASLDVFQRLGDVGRAEWSVFQAKDDEGIPLDCLKAAEVEPNLWLGVSHALRNGRFELRLSESTNLRHWRHIRQLDEHAHQGSLRRFGSRWLAVWEKDGPDGNWIRIAGFDSLASLTKGKAAVQFDVSRTLAPTAEGTPDIISGRIGESWKDSDFKIGFHYYRNADVDRQAVGQLTGFKHWSARALTELDSPSESDWRGNIGDRDRILFKGKELVLLEAQKTKNDWASWRILYSYGSGWQLLAVKTPRGSTSFANPNATLVTVDGKSRVFMSLFLPSQGNAPSESGQLLYLARLP